MTPRFSSPFLSADGRTTYVVDSHGARRRVQIDSAGTVTFIARPGKAARKAAKRARQAARRLDESRRASA
jgi:hypothetical protein